MQRIVGAFLMGGLLASFGAPAQQAGGGSYSANPAAPALPVNAPVGASVLYRCRDGAGVSLYTSRPAPGCVVVGYYAAPMNAPRLAPRALVRAPAVSRYWQGYPCTVDCSGHEAGYQWAERNGTEDPDDCGGDSRSFIEGCKAYAEEVQQHMVEDGECEDSDEDERCD